MRKDINDPCTLCPAFTNQDKGPFCTFFDGQVDPETDGCNNFFRNEKEVKLKLLQIGDPDRS